MKRLIACLFAATSLAALPLPTLAGTDVAVVCGPDVPESWKRAGGYCEKIEGGGSLSTFVDPPGCIVYGFVRQPAATEGVDVAALDGGWDLPLVVADEIDPCCYALQDLGIDLEDMERIEVAIC